MHYKSGYDHYDYYHRCRMADTHKDYRPTSATPVGVTGTLGTCLTLRIEQEEGETQQCARKKPHLSKSMQVL